jgi:murein DD-endopeptidase MepM/ murein hydrolase activator NlpD
VGRHARADIPRTDLGAAEIAGSLESSVERRPSSLTPDARALNPVAAGSAASAGTGAYVGRRSAERNRGGTPVSALLAASPALSAAGASPSGALSTDPDLSANEPSGNGPSAGGYVSRRSRRGSEALSVAALRERMALESLRLSDPDAVQAVAGALAAARTATDGQSIRPVPTTGVDELATSASPLATAVDATASDIPVIRRAEPGRRRASRAGGSSVFRVPTTAAAVPGTRVATARRRATAVARRRPLLLSTPLIAAAIVVSGTVGAQQLTAGGAGTTASGSTGSTGAASLSTSGEDVRVSRSKRDADAVPTSSATATVAPPAAAPAEPLSANAEPLAPPADPVAAPAAGGAPAAVPTETVAPAPPPAAVWVRPVEGGSVTSCFCNRWGTFHDGIDVDPPLGTPIVSVADGTVVFAGPLSGYGIGIYIEHNDGTVTFYGHQAVYFVRTGDVVTAGQEIALVGNEGFSTGPHLHFSVFSSWDGGRRTNAIDPIPYLAERGVYFER